MLLERPLPEASARSIENRIQQQPGLLLDPHRPDHRSPHHREDEIPLYTDKPFDKIHQALVFDYARALVKAQSSRSALSAKQSRRAAQERRVAFDATIAVMLHQRLPLHAQQLDAQISTAQQALGPRERADVRLRRIATACAEHIREQQSLISADTAPQSTEPTTDFSDAR
ncbi:hypothetical protein [Kocuria palustris]|uniref:hypothetical protein n=1 Tax=Kocuria palustris TaxID=71999 RepID=UPI00242DC23B|nr:hypothetical protein [Kocuria palustris]